MIIEDKQNGHSSRNPWGLCPNTLRMFIMHILKSVAFSVKKYTKLAVLSLFWPVNCIKIEGHVALLSGPSGTHDSVPSFWYSLFCAVLLALTILCRYKASVPYWLRCNDTKESLAVPSPSTRPIDHGLETRSVKKEIVTIIICKIYVIWTGANTQRDSQNTIA